MEKDHFTWRPTDDFIELVKPLQLKQIAQSGGHAKMIREEGLVKLIGALELRSRKKLRAGDVIELEGLSIEIRD